MNLQLINRNNLTLTGVKKVKSTETNQIVLLLDNTSLLIQGSNLEVKQLDVSTGNMEISGKVDSLKYTNKVSKSFSLKNIFR